MENSLGETGAVKVNGAFATSIQFGAVTAGERKGSIDVRFSQGPKELATASLTADEAANLLGERNLLAIQKRIAASKDAALVKGELRNSQLHYRDITLPAGAQEVEPDAIVVTRYRSRGPAQNPEIATSRESPGESPKESAAATAAAAWVAVTEGQGKTTEPSASAAPTANGVRDVSEAVDGRPIDGASRDAKAKVAEGAATADALKGQDAGSDKPAARESSEQRTQRGAAPETGESVPNPKKGLAPVPEHIAAKYLVQEDRYHFPDQSVAFVDKGTTLTVKTQNSAVLRDVVAIAQVRDWEEVTVTGTKEFRRAAWKEAYAAGLTVKGYTPSDLDRMVAERERIVRNGPNEISTPPRDRQAAPNIDRSTGAAGPTSERSESRPAEPNIDRPASAASPKSERSQNPLSGVAVGTLVEHGDAPYKNDPGNSMSYYIALRDTAGRVHTYWGVELPKALEDARTKPQIGDVVGLTRAGKTPVTVTSTRIDEAGNKVTEEVSALRNEWVLEKIDYFKASNVPVGLVRENSGEVSPQSGSARRKDVPTEISAADKAASGKGMTRQEEVAAAVRSAATTREELQLKYPELNKAVFEHLSAHDQLAAAFVKANLIRESDRAQVIESLRDRLASRLQRGERIKNLDANTVQRDIAKSVNRVAADLGRPPVVIAPERLAEQTLTPKPLVRDDAQIR
jgi:hypothetical protein